MVNREEKRVIDIDVDIDNDFRNCVFCKWFKDGEWCSNPNVGKKYIEKPFDEICKNYEF